MISLQQLSTLISSLMSTKLQRNNQDSLQRFDSLTSQMSVISQRTEQISQLSSQVSDIEAKVSSLEERERMVPLQFFLPLTSIILRVKFRIASIDPEIYLSMV